VVKFKMLISAEGTRSHCSVPFGTHCLLLLLNHGLKPRGYLYFKCQRFLSCTHLEWVWASPKRKHLRWPRSPRWQSFFKLKSTNVQKKIIFITERGFSGVQLL